MQHHFTRSDPDAPRSMMCVFALLACALGVVWLLNRWQQRRSQPTSLQPTALYHRVQRGLGLSLPDRWWLWRLAKWLSIEHPTALLISSRLYDEAVQRYCAGRGWLGNRAWTAPHFASIRERLFQADR